MLTNAQQHQWQDLVEAHLTQGTFYLDFPDGEDWYCFMDPGQQEQRERELKRWLDGRLPKDETAQAAPKGWHGFMVPIDEVDRIGIKRLREEAEVLTRYRQDFKWRHYLARTAAAVQIHPEVSPVVAGCWHFCWYYAKVLQAARRDRANMVPLLKELPGTTDFEYRLPSEQALEMLLLLCRRPFSHLWDEEAFGDFLQAAHPPVRKYFLQYRTILETALTSEQESLRERAETDFYRLCREDLPCVLGQLLLENQVGRLNSIIPADLLRSIAAQRNQRTKPPKGAIRRGLSRLRRLLSSTSTAPASAPLYHTSFTPFGSSQAAKWYELAPIVLEELGLLELALEEALRPRDAHFSQLANSLTKPMVRWTNRRGPYRPEWHLPQPQLAKTIFQNYQDRLAQEASETARLDELLVRLAKVPSLAGLRTFTERMPKFRSPAVARRWRLAREQHRKQLMNRGQYRTQRMREFGLLRIEESEHRKNLWLDELLQIEEEVRPYVAYVRQAFQAALPVGSTVQFDPYRHRHDGIEFDPDTVGDPDKWLRGEVMKTLQSKRNFAPITQVNTFCLDYSRSMTHELMRDLFKVVFLLVTGLDGRRSFDAIHFFGSDFYEAVDFGESHEFTTRAILFRVLRNIAEVQTHKVVYGGVGGTNISAGVGKSHEKLKAFSARLEEEQPQMNFVSSLFVLTDGQPTIGIFDLDELHDFIEEKRQDGNIAIKGIYLKPVNEVSDFMARIFGAEHSVDATSFDETVRAFVHLMSRTYKDQRKEFRAVEKRRKMKGREMRPK